MGVNKEKANQLAVAWWQTSLLESRACDQCGAPLSRGAGYLCLPRLKEAAPGEAQKKVSWVPPELLCETCFDAAPAVRPFDEEALREALVRRLSEAEWGFKPDEVLQELNGFPVFDALIDILLHQPDQKAQTFLGLRICTIKLLGAMGDERAVQPLLECYRHYLVYEQALVESLEQPPANAKLPRPYWLDVISLSQSGALKNASPQFGQKLLERLPGNHLLQSSANNQLLIENWMHMSTVRARVVQALEKINPPNLIEIVKDLLRQDEQKTIQQIIAKILAKQGDPQAIPALAQDLLSEIDSTGYSPDGIRETLQLLASFPQQEAYAAIRDFYFGVQRKNTKAELAEAARKLIDTAPWRTSDPAWLAFQKEQWRKAGRCEECGAELGFMDKLSGKTRCKQHRA